MAAILVVDDQPLNRELLASILGSAGHSVIEARDGAHALALLREHSVDLVVTDLLMPGMDGYELVRRLRSGGSAASSKVIFYTAHYSPAEAAGLAGALGVARVLSKPSEPEDLLRTAQEVLGGPSQEGASPPSPAFHAEHARILNEKLLETLESLRERNERLEHVLASSPAILVTLDPGDPALAATWISPNVREVLGLEPSQLVRHERWTDHADPDDARRLLRDVPRRLEAHGHASEELRMRDGSGAARWIRCELRLARSLEGRDVVIGSWTDVTERRRLEDQFRQAQRMEAVGRLAGGVAHDFNNLLTIINCYSDELLGALPDGPLRECADEIRKAGVRGTHLTRQLLAFSRRQIVQPVALDVDGLLAEMERMLRRLLGEDVKMDVRPGAGGWRVQADPGQLEQVIMNLAVNARDAMPSGGRLLVETSSGTSEAGGEVVRILVTDTGSGMDPATLARAFEPFFTTKGSKGTGLGLATVQGIVQQAGGRIGIRSSPGAGTCITIELPRTATVASARRPPAGVPPRGSEMIAVAEDDEEVRRIIVTALRRQGYDVVHFPTGEQVLAACRDASLRPDLLVTDVVMPGMSGPHVAAQLRAARPSLKVLFVSGYTDDAILLRGLSDEGMPVLTKPFTTDALAAKVREVLDAGAPRSREE